MVSKRRRTRNGTEPSICCPACTKFGRTLSHIAQGEVELHGNKKGYTFIKSTSENKHNWIDLKSLPSQLNPGLWQDSAQTVAVQRAMAKTKATPAILMMPDINCETRSNNKSTNSGRKATAMPATVIQRRLPGPATTCDRATNKNTYNSIFRLESADDSSCFRSFFFPPECVSLLWSLSDPNRCVLFCCILSHLKTLVFK